MSAFIDTSKIEVRDGENVIWVKRAMDYGTQCRVQDTLTQMALKNGQPGNIHITIGAQNLALAVHNIVGWSGPDFVDPITSQPVACTPENIEKLHPKLPVFVLAQKRINELNTNIEAPDPNG
jgi:hypothetical protein